MHAWLCESLAGPQALTWRQCPDPTPGPHEVCVEVAAASLNYPDLLITQGKYQMRPPLPFVPGAEFAGRIITVGSEVQHLQVGMAVAGMGGTGGFGEIACVAANQLMPIPPQMPMTDAAAFGLTYGTAHHALMDRAALQPGETVLVLGASGGVGSAAIQIAKAAKAKVIAVASSEAKRQACLAWGADAALSDDPERLREELKALTSGRGPDVVMDAVGGRLAEPAFRAIAWRGRYLVVGFAGGEIPALPWNLALLKGASIVGVFWGEFARREPKAFAASMRELMAWYSQGLVKPILDSVLPLSDVPQALERMAQRQIQGKLVIRVKD